MQGQQQNAITLPTAAPTVRPMKGHFMSLDDYPELKASEVALKRALGWSVRGRSSTTVKAATAR